MNSKTASLVLAASKEKVFSYLSDVENLPKWATAFCRELKQVSGKYKVATPMGEMFFRIKADNDTGVVDMFAGPAEDQMGVFPIRVLELPGGNSFVQFTMFQPPDLSDGEFQGQYESLLREFENLKREFSN